MRKNDRITSLAEFDSAPETTLFNQITIAYVRDCSTATLERDRWAGGGIPFIKIGRLVKYRKADVLTWLAQYQPQISTSETGLDGSETTAAGRGDSKQHGKLSGKPKKAGDKSLGGAA